MRTTISRGAAPAADQLAHPRGEGVGLGEPPRGGEALGCGVLGPLVGEQQFDDRRAERRIAAAGAQRPKPIAERGHERRVERVDQLRARAEVDVERRPRALGGQPLPEPLEQLDVGMPEPVDRLLGVADREQVPARDRFDQLELDHVRVLELIDHHVDKPGAVALAQL